MCGTCVDENITDAAIAWAVRNGILEEDPRDASDDSDTGASDDDGEGEEGEEGGEDDGTEEQTALQWYHRQFDTHEIVNSAANYLEFVDWMQHALEIGNEAPGSAAADALVQEVLNGAQARGEGGFYNYLVDTMTRRQLYEMVYALAVEFQESFPEAFEVPEETRLRLREEEIVASAYSNAADRPQSNPDYNRWMRVGPVLSVHTGPRQRDASAAPPLPLEVARDVRMMLGDTNHPFYREQNAPRINRVATLASCAARPQSLERRLQVAGIAGPQTSRSQTGRRWISSTRPSRRPRPARRTAGERQRGWRSAMAVGARAACVLRGSTVSSAHL